ncbi:MAG: peptidoglycan-binding protein [Clostridia bacterium]|nr:peptidoglycan-binding protein [Clostridia bacterium]
MSRQFLEKDAIINLQTYLRAQVFLYPNAIIPPVDGIFDTQTKNALIDFQIRNSLAPTGIADRITFELLYEQYLDILENSSLPNPIIPFPSHPTNYAIKRGENSFLVAVLQFMLNEIGAVYNVFEAIEINGEYDEATENAIRSFQSINSLSPTGETDRKTWNALARIYNLSLHYIENN